MKPSIRLSLFILTLSLFFRLFQLFQTSIQMDEVTWMAHSKTLVYAIVKRDYSFFQEKAWWTWKSENYAIGIPANLAGGISHVLLGGSSRFSLKLLPDIVASRLPIALASALLPLLVYRFLVLVGQPQVGLLAALSLSVSPLMLASDRWFLNDSFLALFSFLALTSFYLSGKNKRLSLWPGVWLALAFLTKPHGILVGLGWLGCFLAVGTRKRYLRLLFFNSVIFFLATTLLWPTAWVNPLFAIPEYLLRQLQLAQVPVQSLFLGKVTLDPGQLYYPFHLLFKNPEIIVFGFFFALLSFVFLKEKRKQLLAMFPFLLYCLAFYFLIHFSGTKAGPRYLVPLIPWFYAVSAFGLVWLYRRLRPPLQLGLLTFGFISLSSVFLYFPDQQIYFNQFIGGPRGVAGTTRLGVCLGGKQALERLDRQGAFGAYYLYGCADNGPYYSGRAQTKDLKKANYLIEEIWLSELKYDDAVMPYVADHFKLLFNVNQYGVITARVYERTK